MLTDNLEDFDPDSADWYCYQYFMTTRASDCIVFQNNEGIVGATDQAAMAILEKANDAAASAGLQGPERPLVRCLVAGIDG